MATFSFDITSEYDKAEMNNVFALTQKEINNRYDFKGTPAAIDWLDNKSGFKIIGANDWQIESIIDIIRKKLATRNQSSKVLDLNNTIIVNNLKASKNVLFVAGLDSEKSKQIAKLIRDNFKKSKPQIQGETIRVASSSKNELQDIMQLIRSQDFNFPVSFTNFH